MAAIELRIDQVIDPDGVERELGEQVCGLDDRNGAENT